MRLSQYVVCLMVIAFMQSCNFNIDDIPGRQVSWSIKSAKKHDTFICAYRANGIQLTGLRYMKFLQRKNTT